VKAVAVFPLASRAVTWTAGVMATPADVFVGCTVKTSCVAVPGLIVKAALVAPPSPAAAAVSVYPVPFLSMLRVEKVAIPAAAATVVVPESVPPPGLVPIPTVTLPVKLVAVFPGHRARSPERLA
jgi:hypothetical protein